MKDDTNAALRELDAEKTAAQKKRIPNAKKERAGFEKEVARRKKITDAWVDALLPPERTLSAPVAGAPVEQANATGHQLPAADRATVSMYLPAAGEASAPAFGMSQHELKFKRLTAPEDGPVPAPVVASSGRSDGQLTLEQAHAVVAAMALTYGSKPAGAGVLLSDALRVPILLGAAPLALGKAGAPPSEFQVLANGETQTLKGVIRCSTLSCTRVLDAMRAAGRDKLPFDYNHGQVGFAGDGRAAGWFVPANRDGALWATQIEWTPRAAAELSAKEWRYFSPALFRDENGNITELVNIALTNLPATINQAPLS